MTPELKARIAEDGLFRTTRLMQLEKRAAMPPSSHSITRGERRASRGSNPLNQSPLLK